MLNDTAMKTQLKAVETIKAKGAVEVYKEKALAQVKQALSEIGKGVFLF